MWDPWDKHNTPAKLTQYDPDTYQSSHQLASVLTQELLDKMSASMPEDTSLEDIIRLAGIKDSTHDSYGSVQSNNATKLAQYQREHGIQPGTQEWFRLWFALPKMTGERPHD